MNLGQFQGIDPREGAEFDREHPQLDRRHDFEIGTSWSD